MTHEEKIRVALENVLLALASDKSKIKVELATLTRAMHLTVHASPVDFGRIIGKQGANFKAFEAVLKIAGERIGRQVELTVLKPQSNGTPDRQAFEPRTNWSAADSAKLAGVIRAVAELIFNGGTVTHRDTSEVSTAIEIKIGGDEDFGMSNELLEDHLSKIVKAAARAMGRDVTLYLIQTARSPLGATSR